eukprot:1155635-Pelagomonas_calceolata.AAC.2
MESDTTGPSSAALSRPAGLPLPSSSGPPSGLAAALKVGPAAIRQHSGGMLSWMMVRGVPMHVVTHITYETSFLPSKRPEEPMHAERAAGLPLPSSRSPP